MTSDKNQDSQYASYRQGKDEMNLAEFPVTGISDRYLDGKKTVVLQDKVWDREHKAMLPREMAISGSDRYGLPTAKDDDILLACVQLSSMADFESREVHFSRFALLKLLKWEDSTRNYKRIHTSLRRWLGVTIYSNRAFYDHANKSWVNRDFGIFDNLYVYEREGLSTPQPSWFVWNEVLYNSFQSGYLKTLDWELYCQLKNPVAKRLYRLLDKRFYRNQQCVMNLHDLAFNRIRMSSNYNTSQIKRSLQKGIDELEAFWDLKSNPNRFKKTAEGKWEVVFEKHSRTKKSALNPQEQALRLRSVNPKIAKELAGKYSKQKIDHAIKIYDSQKYKTHSPGYLVTCIKQEAQFTQTNETEKLQSKESLAERKFDLYWKKLSSLKKQQFEAQALKTTDQTKRQGYERMKEQGGLVFDLYRRMILVEYFSCM